MQNKKRRGQQEQLQMPVSGEQAKSQYEKNGTVRDESIFYIESIILGQFQTEVPT